VSDNETTTKTPGPLTNAKSVQFNIPLSGGGWVVDHLCLYNNGQYVDAGNSGWWEVIPVAANSPQPAYGFRSGNVYMAGSMVDVPNATRRSVSRTTSVRHSSEPRHWMPEATRSP